MSACAITGHRILPFSMSPEAPERDRNAARDFLSEIDQTIRLLSQIYKVDLYYFGGAMGADIIVAERVLSLKRELFPNIKLHAALPFVGHTAKWSNDGYRERLAAVLEQCDEVDQGMTIYKKDAYKVRNEKMVNAAQHLIAVWNGKPSGTGNTVRYAKSLNRDIHQIDPDRLLNRS